jgi:hypothetical protein
LGVYKFPDGSAVPSIEITIQNGSLFGSSANGSATLTKVSKDTFSILSYNGMAYFKRNADAKIKGIKIELPDVLLEGDKEGAQAWLQRKEPRSYWVLGSKFEVRGSRFEVLRTHYSRLTTHDSPFMFY